MDGKKRGPKVSQEMANARADMLANPSMSAYRAAKNHGLTTGAITRSPWYRDVYCVQKNAVSGGAA